MKKHKFKVSASNQDLCTVDVNLPETAEEDMALFGSLENMRAHALKSLIIASQAAVRSAWLGTKTVAPVLDLNELTTVGKSKFYGATVARARSVSTRTISVTAEERTALGNMLLGM
jgi:hypothetical protein